MRQKLYLLDCPKTEQRLEALLRFGIEQIGTRDVWLDPNFIANRKHLIAVDTHPQIKVAHFQIKHVVRAHKLKQIDNSFLAT